MKLLVITKSHSTGPQLFDLMGSGAERLFPGTAVYHS